MKRHSLFWILGVVVALCLVPAFSCTDNDNHEEDNPPGDDDDSSSGPANFDDDDDDLIPADDDDDNDTDDDTADDDISQEPAIAGVEHGTCKDGSGPAKEEWPEQLLLTYTGNVLTVTHVNGVFNCCLDSIEVTMQLNGFTIDLYEEEYAPNPCYCICPFDVITHIANLVAGSYTVNVYANGTFSLSGQVTIP